MSRKKVVIADPIHQCGVDRLSELHDVALFHSSDREACYAEIASADAVIVRTIELPATIINRSPQLRAIVKHGAGVDNIDLDAAFERGIVIANTGDSNSGAVAEAAVSLLFASLRRTPAMHRLVQQDQYSQRWNVILGDLTSKTLGVVGFGNIGQRVARMCRQGFGMSIVAFDPYQSDSTFLEQSAERVASLDELLGRSDAVTLHVGLSDRTHHLIGRAELALMKPGAVLVNTARGGVVDEVALFDALATGQIFGAGLDVFEREPPNPSNPLFSLDNVVLSPHIGGATLASRQLTSMRSAEAAIEILAGRQPAFPLRPDKAETR